jgi:hypothetical protein
MSEKGSGNFKVLFVAGFGPIVKDAAESHKFYLDALGLSFERHGDYLHTQKLKGVKHFALWPLSLRRHNPVLVQRHGRLNFQFLKHGWNSMLIILTKPPQRWKKADTNCWLARKKNRGDKLSLACSVPKDY